MPPFAQPVLTSGTPHDVEIDPDGRTFTLRYADFQVAIESGSVPVAARWEWVSITIPVADAIDVATLAISGYAVTDAGSRATLLVVAGGQPRVVEFEPDTDREFVEEISWLADSGRPELHLSIGVLVERREAHGGSATVAVSTVDGRMEIAVPDVPDGVDTGANI